jgi:hypothetical protein
LNETKKPAQFSHGTGFKVFAYEILLH